MRRFNLLPIIILLLTASAVVAAVSLASDKGKPDPSALFPAANAYYEKRDYAKAIETYLEIIDLGYENGNLYYNIANSFFKLNKLGYAILCYERAARFIPGDRDLKSNLVYAKTSVEEPYTADKPQEILVRGLLWPFKDINLDDFAWIAIIFYLLIMAFSLFNLLKPTSAKRVRMPYLAFLFTFLFTVCAFGMRYYHEKILRQAIVLEKEADSRYEPIDKSTVYYKVREGQKVTVLKTRNGWCQIRRSDGKIGWVPKETVEEI